MIGCGITGGLGNQFFRYAFARKLFEERRKCGISEELLINGNGIDGHGSSGSLFDFKLAPHKRVDCNRMIMKYGNVAQRLLYAAYAMKNHSPAIGKILPDEQLKKMLGKAGVIVSDNPDNEHLYLPSMQKSRVFTYGSFENASFFAGIEGELMGEFTPPQQLLYYNKKLYDVITHANSVFLGVRRGDFLQGNNRRIFYVCDLTYYQRAIRYMQVHVPEPVFIVFSNDIPWVKENLKIDGEAYFESGRDPVWETFRLMYSCRHFIISNSTLHWWAQFRSENEGKIVVAPERWYNDPGWLEHLMLPSFIRVKTGVRNPYLA